MRVDQPVHLRPLERHRDVVGRLEDLERELHVHDPRHARQVAVRQRIGRRAGWRSSRPSSPPPRAGRESVRPPRRSCRRASRDARRDPRDRTAARLRTCQMPCRFGLPSAVRGIDGVVSACGCEHELRPAATNDTATMVTRERPESMANYSAAPHGVESAAPRTQITLGHGATAGQAAGSARVSSSTHGRSNVLERGCVPASA